MKKHNFALTVAIISVLGVSVSFCAQRPDKNAYGPAARAAAREMRISRMKTILLELVRQDEYLDGAIETLDSPNAGLTPADIAALNRNLGLIKKNMDTAANLSKAQLTEIRAGSNLVPYTKAILVYSAKMDAKAARVALLAGKLSEKNKKAAMRDAVSAKKSGSGGKTITRILEEQQALKKLSSGASGLKASSARLAATGKWLYIASK